MGVSLFSKKRKRQFLKLSAGLLFILLVLQLFLIAFFLGNPAKTTDNEILSESRSVSAKCRDKTVNCYIVEVTEISESKGVNFALNVLLDLQKNDPKALDCHGIAHKVGRVAFSKDVDNWRNVIRGVDPSICTGGLIHGVVEALQVNSPEFLDDSLLVREICSLAKRAAGENSCIHIIGHLFLVETEGNAQQAVEKCNSVASDFEDRGYQCLIGLFMEHTTRINLIEHGLEKGSFTQTINENFVREMEDLCRAQVDVAAVTCWREISRLYFRLFDEDFEATWKECGNAPEATLAENCQVYASNLLVHENTALEQAEVCTRFTKFDLRERCTLDAVSIMVGNSPNSVPKAVEFCESFKNGLIGGCFAQIGVSLWDVASSEEIKTYCLAVPEDFRDSCLIGTRQS